MILQTYSILNERIKRKGCYVMSILFFGNKYKDYPLSGLIINDLYNTFVDRGFIDKDCYVKDPEAIFSYIHLPVEYTDKHESKDRICGNRELEILMFQIGKWKHFCAGTGNGAVAYDPMGCSRCVR